MNDKKIYEGIHEHITISEMLIKAARGTNGITFLENGGKKTVRSYASLLYESKCILKGLRDIGLGPSSKVIILVDDISIFVPTFWSCILGGIIPIVLKEPQDFRNNEDILKLTNTCKLFKNPLILTNAETREKLIKCNNMYVKHLRVINIADVKGTVPTEDIYHSREDEPVLYLLTSGTTGTPKAVEYTNYNISSNIIASKKVIRGSNKDVIMNWMPLYHGASLFSQHILGMYLGCNQVLSRIEEFLSKPLDWFNWLDEHRATITWAPPFAFSLLNEQLASQKTKKWDLSSVRYIFSGGQSIVMEKIEEFFHLMSVNGLSIECFCPQYGMTEACGSITYGNSHNLWNHVIVDPTTGTIESEMVKGRLLKKLTDLGEVLPGLKIRIVDETNKIINEKQIGRVQIKGPMVIKGYYKNSTADKLSFTTDGWFNTGDVGFLSRGRLILTGRQNDIFIKNAKNYHYYDIEAVLEKTFGIESTYLAAGSTRNDDEENDQLVIFFTPIHWDIKLINYIIEEIRNIIASKFGIQPDVIIPTKKDEFLKTITGKVQRLQLIEAYLAKRFEDNLNEVSGYFKKGENEQDFNESINIEYKFEEEIQRSKLYYFLNKVLKEQLNTDFDIQFEKRTKDYQGTKLVPEKNLSTDISEIWKSSLGIKESFLNDNFFYKGGDSLKGFRLLNELNNLYGVSIKMTELYKNPTLKELILAVEEKKSVDIIIEKNNREFFPLTPSQKGQWVFYKMNQQSSVYTTNFTLDIAGKLSIEKLRKSIQGVLERHESLRARFCLIDNNILQWIDSFKIDLPIIDLSEYDLLQKELEITKHVNYEINKPFCLEEDKLIRVMLMKIAKDEHKLIVCMHHIIIDGWSTELIIREIIERYQSLIENKTVEFKSKHQKYTDYLLAQNKLFNGNNVEFENQKGYWMKELSKKLPVLYFPKDYPDESLSNYDGTTILQVLDKDLSSKIKETAKYYQITTFTLSLSLYAYLLSNYSNQTEFIIGTVMSNRQPSNADMVGYVANTIPLRINLSGDPTFKEMLDRVNLKILQASENQQVPLEIIQEIVDKEPNKRLFETMFNFQNQFEYVYKTNDFIAKLSLLNNETAKYNFLLNMAEEEGKYHLRLEYNTNMYSRESMEKLLEQYTTLLKAVTNKM